jgi:hypothetical protein
MRKYSWGSGSLGIERILNGYIIRWVEESYRIVGADAPMRHEGSTHVKTVLEDSPNVFKSHVELLDFIIGYFNMDLESKEKRICISLGDADKTVQEWHGDSDILETALKED